MERIRREASRILALYKVHSEHTWPRRLVFKNPNLESGKSAVFQHLYAGAYHTPATVEVWLSENTTQGDLGRLSATRDFGMGETPLASLRVVVLHGEGGKRHILHVDRTVFFELFSTLALDEYALYLYLTNVPGLHFLGRKTPKADDGSPVFDFYLNAIDYTFIWSYDQGTQATNVILIGEADAKWETNQLLDAMCVKDHIIFNPLYLAFLACSRGFLDTWECDVEFIPTQNVVRRKTMELDLDAAADLSQFSEAGLGFGKSLNSSVRSLRILRVLQSIANQLDPAHADSLWNQALGITGVAGQRDDGGKDDTVCQSASQIQTAMLFLQRQLTSRVGHFEGQIRWSKVNMQLATARIQRTEACLANRDSRAMISIAYTTMVFLPGAFMAALFDMEAATEAMKSDFGLYWKLVVPLTIFVLLFWDMTTRKAIQRRVLAPARRRWASWRKVKGQQPRISNC